MRKLWAESKVSIDAISRLERGQKLRDRTLEDIKRVFEAAGIEFGPTGKIGMKDRRQLRRP
jgi:hypothetical protein